MNFLVVFLWGILFLFIALISGMEQPTVAPMTTPTTPAPLYEHAMGQITTVIGKVNSTDNDGLSNVVLQNPYGLWADSSNNIYFTEVSTSVVRVLNHTTKQMSTIAGTGVSAIGGTVGSATSVSLFTPTQLFLNSTVNELYVCSFESHFVYKIDLKIGLTKVIAGTGIAVANGNGYKATSAGLSGALGIWCSSTGFIYISQPNSNMIRQIYPVSNIITQLAGRGNGAAGYDGDNGLATSAALRHPLLLCGDSSGMLFITDTGNMLIRKVQLNIGIITLFAGVVSVAQSTDVVMAATSATLFSPRSISGDLDGRLFVGEQAMSKIKTIAFGSVSTLVGVGGVASTNPTHSNGDGGPPRQATIGGTASCMFTDTAGNLYFSDKLNNRIRKVYNCAPTSQPTSQPSNPSGQPTSHPSQQPYAIPSRIPTSQPTATPSLQPSAQPTGLPSMQPTIFPSQQPAAEPSSVPSQSPTSQPSSTPSGTPKSQPSLQPSRRPSVRPTGQPSSNPSHTPSSQPSATPSWKPSTQPSKQPSAYPSLRPTGSPSTQPSALPSSHPSPQPTSQPFCLPSSQPSSQPTSQPSCLPSRQPSSQPSCVPSSQPSSYPSSQPSCLPSSQPSPQPSSQPSCSPSSQPSSQPTSRPSLKPSNRPSSRPSTAPSRCPDGIPSTQPSSMPTQQPSTDPSSQPSCGPTIQPMSYPSGMPTDTPSTQPTARPSVQPSVIPTVQPSAQPANQPSSQPTSVPTDRPTSQPSTSPTIQPIVAPTGQPSCQPSGAPSIQPKGQPSSGPTGQPSDAPSNCPTIRPSSLPSLQPSLPPTAQPSIQPSTCPSVRPSSHPSIQPTFPTREPTFISNGLVPSTKPLSVVYLNVRNTTQFVMVLPFQFVSFVRGDQVADVVVNEPTFGSSRLMFDNVAMEGAAIISVADLRFVTPSVSYDFSGRSVSIAGDINGDGYDDLIIGVPFAAKVYVLFGSVRGFLNMTEGFTVYGAKSSDLTGWSVSGAGDVNNDTLADIVIGAPHAGIQQRGVVYVLFGMQSGFNNVVLSVFLPVLHGFRVEGQFSQEFLGLSVSCAGDVNHDGVADIIAGALRANSLYSGSAVVILGGQQIGGPIQLWREIVGQSWSWFGYSVSSADDMNGDGISELIIGSLGRKTSLSQPLTYLWFGNHSFNGAGPATTVSTMEGTTHKMFLISGGGVFVSGLGDISGDSLGDVIIGTDYGLYSGGGLVVVLPDQPPPEPTTVPTGIPSTVPTQHPSSKYPSYAPSTVPSIIPTRPTAVPTQRPSGPTYSPSMSPTQPSSLPTASPTSPSGVPSVKPTYPPSWQPSIEPSVQPTCAPTATRTAYPVAPTTIPTTGPSRPPVFRPTALPTAMHLVQNTTFQQVILVVANTSTATVYRRTANNTHYIINSTVNITITSNATNGAAKFTVLPNPNTTLTIQYFIQTLDVVDITAFPIYRWEDFHMVVSINSTSTLTYMTIDLGRNQKIIIIHHTIAGNISEKHFIFAQYQIENVRDEHESNNVHSHKLTSTIVVVSIIITLVLYSIYKCILQRNDCILKKKVESEPFSWEEMEKGNRTFVKFVYSDFFDQSLSSSLISGSGSSSINSDIPSPELSLSSEFKSSEESESTLPDRMMTGEGFGPALQLNHNAQPGFNTGSTNYSGVPNSGHNFNTIIASNTTYNNGKMMTGSSRIIDDDDNDDSDGYLSDFTIEPDEESEC